MRIVNVRLQFGRHPWMIGKLLSIVVRNRLATPLMVLHAPDDFVGHLILGFRFRMAHHQIATLPFDQRDQCPLVPSPDHRISLPVPDS